MVRRWSPTITAAVVLAIAASPASAHHEAIYGASSALGVSADRYFTGQLFTRRTGPPDDETQETTTVLSGGFTPGKSPMSLSVVVPFSVVADGDGRRVGLENAIVAGRYRMNLPALARALRLEESSVLGAVGIEVPTGTIDYGFFEGAPAAVGGVTVGLERRPISIISYLYLNRYAERSEIRDSGHTFFGTGVAWTPIDDEPAGRLFSVQFGVSRDSASREELAGVPQAHTGGWAWVASPAVVWSVKPGVLWFVSASMPLSEQWRNRADEERFRVGSGCIVSLTR
jgi:hypothetical protein